MISPRFEKSRIASATKLQGLVGWAAGSSSLRSKPELPCSPDIRTMAAQDGIVVSAIALAATLALLAYQRHVIARTSSLAIATDHAHYQSAARRCAGMRNISLCRTGSARW